MAARRGPGERALTRARRWLGENRRRLTTLLVVFLLVAAAGVGWYVATPHRASAEDLTSVRANDDVRLSTAGDTYVLEPATPPADRPRVGLVFYPGANVHPDAYLPSLAPLAARANVTVVVPSMRLTLAIFDQNAATPVIRQHPAVDTWYVGGHSLGGAMACRYANTHRDRVTGLVLFASYCDRDLHDSDLRVLSVAGRADTVLNRERYRASQANLPADATVVELDGVNHTQFAAYTGQRGDRPSGTTYATAHERIAAVTVPWFERANATARVQGPQ